MMQCIRSSVLGCCIIAVASFSGDFCRHICSRMHLTPGGAGLRASHLYPIMPVARTQRKRVSTLVSTSGQCHRVAINVK